MKNMPKTKVMGYGLFMNLHGEPKGWKRYGHLFQTSLEASEFRERKYPGVTKWSIQRIRVNVEPVVRESK